MTVFLLTGCAGNSDSGPAGGTSGAGTADAAPEMLAEPDAATAASIVGLIIEPLPSGMRSEGVRITVEDHPEIEAVYTDADGIYRIADVPANTPLVLRADKADFVPAASRVFNSGTGEFSMDIMFMLPIESFPLLADISNVEERLGLGVIIGNVASTADGNALAGVRVATDPLAGVYRYSAETGYIDPELTETTTHGSFVVWHLEPGDYQLGAGAANHSCRAAGNDAPTSATVRVYANTMSHASFVCD